MDDGIYWVDDGIDMLGTFIKQQASSSVRPLTFKGNMLYAPVKILRKYRAYEEEKNIVCIDFLGIEQGSTYCMHLQQIILTLILVWVMK